MMSGPSIPHLYTPQLWSSKCTFISQPRIPHARHRFHLNPRLTVSRSCGARSCLQAVARLPEHEMNTRHPISESRQLPNTVYPRIHGPHSHPSKRFKCSRTCQCPTSLPSNCVICAPSFALKLRFSVCVRHSQPTLFRIFVQPNLPCAWPILALSHDFTCLLPRSPRVPLTLLSCACTAITKA